MVSPRRIGEDDLHPVAKRIGNDPTCTPRFPGHRERHVCKRLIALIAASCSTMAIANESTWTVSEMSGSVQVAHRGMSRIATRGLSVTAGDTVTTGLGARAVLVRGTEYMMVAAGSRLQLQPEVQSSGLTQMIEEFGNVVFMIKKKTTPHFEVRTPYLAAVVKGTTFAVGVTPQGASVQVLEGAVEVATGDGGARDLLRPGSVAIVAENDRYRMRVETNGVTKIVESPAATGHTTTSQTTLAVGRVVPTAARVIAATVYEASVALDTVTGGLINGTTGGRSDVAGLTNATRTATEASTSAVKAIDAVKTSIAASAEQDKASAAASTSAQAANVAAEAKASAEQAAQAAAVVAQRAADAAALASADDAKGSTNAAAAAAAADAATKAASAAADAAAKAEANRSAAAATQAATQAAADQAAKDATKAAADLENHQNTQANNGSDAAAKAAADAAKVAQKAADAAAKAAFDALKGK